MWEGRGVCFAPWSARTSALESSRVCIVSTFVPFSWRMWNVTPPGKGSAAKWCAVPACADLRTTVRSATARSRRRRTEVPCTPLTVNSADDSSKCADLGTTNA